MILGIYFSVIFFTAPASIVEAGEENKTVEEYYQDQTNHEGKSTSNELENNISDIKTPASVTIIDFIKMLFAFMFVLLIIYILVKVVKSQRHHYIGTKYLQNIGGTSLGQNRSIQLVKVGERILLLGVSDTIQLLKEIDDEAEIEKILQEHEAKVGKYYQKPIQTFWKWNESKHKNNTLFKDELQAILKERSGQMKLFLKKGNKHNE
jgi:flagellar protein FliO/FliZ